MIGLTHFALGLLVAVLFIVPAVDSLNESTVLVASGVWAMMPDVAHFIPQLSPLFDGWWINVFYLHGLMDSMETAYPQVEALVAVLTLVFAVALVERRA